MAKGKYEKWLTPDGLTLLEAWARDGLTDEQIAHNVGVSVKTLYNWKESQLPILHALKKGKEVVDIEVENALYKSAIGYDYEEVTQETVVNPMTGEAVKDENGKPIIATTKIVKKHVQPSNTAQIFWLKNRQPDKWRDKPPEQSGKSEDENDNFYQAVEDAVKHEV